MHEEIINDLTPEEQILLDYQTDLNQHEFSNRMTELEENGLYIRNLLNHINDKLVQPAASRVMPAVNLAISSAGTVATVALGVLYLVSKLR